ncbi:phosphatase [Streptomyces olivaceoviridis]|uniref:HAD family hydrolase n=1 Tax=Streptomyces olivaceoviridis TaxID=1921 RepID=UPI001672AC6B|nr:HAD family phosphatase [Streptomyces olivaceoviridis]GGZ15320.1 phosphatase [Streptomyces olivaceoviridis]
MPSIHQLPADDFDALVFDWDGTLADTLTAHYTAMSTVLAPHGLTVDADWYATATGMSTDEAVLWLSRHQNVELTLPVADLVEQCEAAYLGQLDKVREITAVADIARAGHGRMPMAVASGGRRRSIVATMKHLALDALFDVVVSREDVRRGKPEPDIFLAAAAALDVPPARCLVLEDSEAGFAAAERASMTVIDIRRHLHHA